MIRALDFGFLFVPLSVADSPWRRRHRRAVGRRGLGFIVCRHAISAQRVGISVVGNRSHDIGEYVQVNHSGDWVALRHIGSIGAFEGPGMTGQLFGAQLPLLGCTSRRARCACRDPPVPRSSRILMIAGLLMIATLAVVPLLIIFTKPSRDVAPDHTQVME